jgi:hypothetical protein
MTLAFTLLPSVSAACLALCVAGCGGEQGRGGGQEAAQAPEAVQAPEVAAPSLPQPAVHHPVSQRPPMKLYLWESGAAREVTPPRDCAERIPALLDELFAGAIVPLRLLVTEEWIQEARAQGRWVEVRYDATTIFTSRTRGEFALDRLLIPLEHPTLAQPPPTPESPRPSPNVTLFMAAGEEGWISGPLANPEGWPLALELEACLGR